LGGRGDGGGLPLSGRVPYSAGAGAALPELLGRALAGPRRPRTYGADQLPVTVLIDRSGHIAVKHAGVVAKSDCKAEIEALL